MIVIARHPEGVSLNGFEYVLDEDGNLKKFETEDDAMFFLNSASGEQFTKEEWDNQGIYFLNEEDFENNWYGRDGFQNNAKRPKDCYVVSYRGSIHWNVLRLNKNKMKRIFRNNYFEIEAYWNGIAVGVVYDDGELMLIAPLVIFRLKTYMFGRNKNNQADNVL